MGRTEFKSGSSSLAVLINNTVTVFSEPFMLILYFHHDFIALNYRIRTVELKAALGPWSEEKWPINK